MAYISSAEFASRFTQTELDNLLTGRSTGFEKCEADAAGEINSYIAGRYLVPLTYVPDRIKAVSADITRYRLYDDAAPQEVRTRYEDAVRWLIKVADGLVLLTDAEGNPLPLPEEEDLLAVGPVSSAKTLVYGQPFVDAFDLQQPRWPYL